MTIGRSGAAAHYDPFCLRSMKAHFSRYPDAARIAVTGTDRQDFLQTAAELMKTESRP